MSSSRKSGRVSRRNFIATATAGLGAFGAMRDALAQGNPKGAGAGKPAAEGPAEGAAGTGGWKFGPFDTLREYIEELDDRGLLLRVGRVDQDAYEGTALMYRLVDTFGVYEAPAVLFEKLKVDGNWMDGPVIANPFGHWSTEAIAFGIDPIAGDGRATYRAAIARVQELMVKGAFPLLPPVEVSRGAALCKQVILRGADIDLTKFAFVQTNPADAGRYVNTGSVFTSDVELGNNFGTYRCQIKGPRKLGVNPEPGQGGWRMFMKKKERGDKVAHVSIVLGQDPITWVVSSSKLARGQPDELALVGGIRGKPLQVVRSETNDMLIPALSELVIEGTVPLDQPMLPEGPFGEMYGYMGLKKDENFWMDVTCITHRKEPWLVNSITGLTRGFPTAPLETMSILAMRRFYPNILEVHSPVEATGLTFVRIDKNRAGQGLEIGKKIAEIIPIAKVIVVVDKDIDVLNRTRVMHALGSRWQAQPATAIIPKLRGMPLDPSLTDRPNTSKAVIDATKQWPEEGGPQVYPDLNIALLEKLAPDAFANVDANWKKLVGNYRPPGR